MVAVLYGVSSEFLTLLNRQDTSAYHHLGLASGVGNDGFLNGQHSNDPSLDKLQGNTVQYYPSYQSIFF